MKFRWKVEVQNFGAGVGLKKDPVLQTKERINGVWGEWEDVPIVEVEEEVKGREPK